MAYLDYLFERTFIYYLPKLMLNIKISQICHFRQRLKRSPRMVTRLNETRVKKARFKMFAGIVGRSTYLQL